VEYYGGKRRWHLKGFHFKISFLDQSGRNKKQEYKTENNSKLSENQTN
jgi:hypothetical protein